MLVSKLRNLKTEIIKLPLVVKVAITVLFATYIAMWVSLYPVMVIAHIGFVILASLAIVVEHFWE